MTLLDPWAGDPNYPPKPKNLKPLVGNAARMKRWGAFKWEPVGDSRIRILGDWRKRNIVEADVPLLSDILGRRKVWLHREVVERFEDLICAWALADLLPLVLTWNGSFVPRRIRGRQSLSSHSWGTAFDLNARWNGIGKQPALIGERGQVRDLVTLAAQHGFYWGGWYSRKDGMHFEAC